VKRSLLILAIGFAAPVLQGALSSFMPARFVPDLGLLIVIAMGLYWRSTGGGLALALVFGFASDLMSGSLLGQQALMRLLAFSTARLASGHLNLRGAVPQSVFALGFTAVNALGIAVLSSYFTVGGGIDFVMLTNLIPHALVNAVLISPISRGIEAVATSFGDDEGARRAVRLSPRSRPA
jgi:rod shape-determining protein MreD